MLKRNKCSDQCNIIFCVLLNLGFFNDFKFFIYYLAHQKDRRWMIPNKHFMGKYLLFNLTIKFNNSQDTKITLHFFCKKNQQSKFL